MSKGSDHGESLETLLTEAKAHDFDPIKVLLDQVIALDVTDFDRYPANVVSETAEKVVNILNVTLENLSGRRRHEEAKVIMSKIKPPQTPCYLFNLPVELIEKIAALTPRQDLNRLCQTNSRLGAICRRPLYQSVELAVIRQKPHNVWQNAVPRSVDKFLEQSNHLLAHPSRLVFTQSFRYSNLLNLGLNLHDETLTTGYDRKINKALGSILSHFLYLSRIRLEAVILSNELLTILSSLPSLQVVTLLECITPESGSSYPGELFDANCTPRKWESNLTKLVMRDVDYKVSKDLVLSNSPHSVFWSRNFLYMFSPKSLTNVFNPQSTANIVKLVLLELELTSFAQLCLLMNDRDSMDVLPNIKHLTLGGGDDPIDAIHIQLMACIKRPELESLCLVRYEDQNHETYQMWADTFPNLTTLCLFWQIESGQLEWDYSMCTLGRWLKQFPLLKRFGFNHLYSVDPSRYVSTILSFEEDPSLPVIWNELIEDDGPIYTEILLNFENGFSKSTQESIRTNCWKGHYEEDESDGALELYENCRTLESIAFLSDHDEGVCEFSNVYIVENCLGCSSHAVASSLENHSDSRVQSIVKEWNLPGISSF